MTQNHSRAHAITAIIIAVMVRAAFGDSYPIEVLPPEHRQEVDPRTGAELNFLTTDPADDTNLYFHERSWTGDGDFILFYAQRERGGLMAYASATGELLRLHTPAGALASATAAVTGNRVWARRGDEVVELTLSIAVSNDPSTARSTATATERIVCVLPPAKGGTALNESADGRHLAIGLTGLADGGEPAIFVIDTMSGVFRIVCRVGEPPGYSGHVQWSRADPNLLSLAGDFPRLQVVDIRDGKPRSVYSQLENELVTHECWWTGRTMLFTGGLHPEPTEDSHVKLIDVDTGAVRIVGPGAWWPDGEDEAVAKQNHWHASGSDDGTWIAADNWHGDITLFEGNTARPHVLTVGHRVYGSGQHPHVGWDRAGRQVIFTSYNLGDANVCVATIPDAWHDAVK